MIGWSNNNSKKVMHTAVGSSVIVNSLFPANVRDRLKEDAVQKQQEQQTCQILQIIGICPF
jgi:hypothetical protein